MFLIDNATDRIILRPWKLSDLDDLVKFANNENISKNLTDGFPYPYTAKDGETFITKIRNDNPVKIFAIEINSIASGSIGIFQQNDINKLNAELGYWLAEPHWGKGIMALAVKEIISYGFDALPITRIFARPFPTNIASINVLEKAGMKLECVVKNSLIKKGIIFDELIYSTRKPE